MVALGIASLLVTQSQSKPIPDIDWNNLPYQQQVKQMADGWRQKYHLPGVWVALIKDGKVVACVATGVKNVETGTPALVTDHLNVGSVSKVITGMMIAQFVAKGVIRYDTTVREVFPELASKYPASPFARATLGQLMTHTSGITAKTKFDLKDENDGVIWRRKQVTFALASDQTIEPGTKYEYSRGPNIATAMIEKRLESSPLANEYGHSYEEWLLGSIGKSIGLNFPQLLDYSKVPGVTEVQPHYLNEFGSKANKKIPSESAVHDTGASCSITLPDICSFAMATIKNDANLPADVYFQATKFQSPRGQFATQKTFASWDGNDERYLHHSGSTGRGEICHLWVSCPRKAALFFYTNANFPPPDGGEQFAKHTASIGEDWSRLRLLIAPMK